MILIEHHVMVKVNNISRFFRDEIEIFSNLVVRDDQDLFLLYLVFRDEIENLLYNISDFEKGARNKTINSRGRARILDANSRETFRDREFSPMSALRSLEEMSVKEKES